MWFNNALLYQYKIDSEDLEAALEDAHLKPCPPHARFSYGWVAPFGKTFVHTCMGHQVICLGKEERVLPRNVIQREVEARVNALEAQRGYPVKRAERAQMAEDLEFELLPQSFCVEKRLLAIMSKNYLIINTSSTTQAAQFTQFLRKSIPSIELEPITAAEALASRFANWIINPSSLPAHISLASDCVLFSPQDEKKRVHCKGYDLPAEEIQALLSQGLVAAEISFIWRDRIQLSLTQELILKRLKCLDYLTDDYQAIHQLGEEEQQDAALALLAGELLALYQDLIMPLTKDVSKPSVNRMCEV